MRPLDDLNIDAQDASLDTDGDLIDASQLFAASGQAVLSGAAAGTFVLQASNDIPPSSQAVNSGFTPTNWINIPSATVNTTAAGSYLIPKTDICYRWIRSSFTYTGTGVQTITAIADTSAANATAVTTLDDTGAFESINITCPDGATAVQADYFVIYSPTGGSAAFWLDIDADGTLPTGATFLAASTKIKVSILSTDTDTDVAAAVISAATSTESYNGVDNMDGTVTYTQVDLGVCTAPVRHAANGTGTGTFGIAVATAGAASNLLNTYFDLYSTNNATAYYVWMDVSGLGVDPAIVGKTGISVAFAAGETQANIASAIASAVQGAGPDFTTNAAPTQAVIHNATVGPCTAASDGAVPTGFTIVTTVPGANSNLNSTYFFINDAAADGGVEYYLWMDVDSGGVDPMIAGKTGVPVTIVGGDTDVDVATAVVSAINGAASITAANGGGTLAAITCTNASAGAFVPASDFNTGFTFAGSQGIGTVSAIIKALGA